MTHLDLDETDRAILAILQENPMARQADVARQLNKTANQISRRYKNPALQAAIEDLLDSFELILKRAKKKAAKKIGELIDSENESISLKACQSLLKPELEGQAQPELGPIRFVTVVNDVGVLESKPTKETAVIEADSIDS